MQSFGDKLRNIGFGQFHDLLDGIRNLDQPASVRQEIRDLADARQKISAAEAEERGTITGLNRKLVALHTQDAADDMQVKLLLIASQQDPSKEAEATALAAENSEVEAQIVTAEAELTAANAKMTSFVQVGAAMEARQHEMEARLVQLEAAIKVANAQNQAAKAIESASDAMDSVGGNGIDDVLAQSQHKQDVADARLQMALGKFSTSPVQTARESVVQIQAKEKIAALKAQMGIGASAAVPAIAQTAGAPA